MPKKKNWAQRLKGKVKKLVGSKKAYVPVKGLGKARTVAEAKAVERRLALKAEERRKVAATKSKTKKTSKSKHPLMDYAKGYGNPRKK